MTVKTTSRFRKDYKPAKKRGLDLALPAGVLDVFLAGKAFDAKHKDHALAGEYAGFITTE